MVLFKKTFAGKTGFPKLKAFLKGSLAAVVIAFPLFLMLNRVFPLPPPPEYSTTVYDSSGNIIHAFLTPGEKWRMETETGEISPLLRRFIIAKEDRYFHHHPGVNPLAMARAAWNNILQMKRTSGASTITMQVARALQPRRRTWFAKLIETFRAFQLEWKYSKEEILRIYLNILPYGGNIEGVKAASLFYFQKNPDHLSLAEIATLCVIPNRPSSLVIGRNNDVIVAARNRLLAKFEKSGLFTAEEIEDALREPLSASRQPPPAEIPHLARKLRASGESNIRTWIDLNTQHKVEKLVYDHIRSLQSRNIHNAAVIVTDNRSGRVISYAGSALFSDTTDGGQVNGAMAVRQPGSTLKPLLYGLCFDEGLLTPKSVIADVPVMFEGYAPENYDQRFRGPVTVEYALDHSLNIPSVRALRMLGNEKMIDQLVKCDFGQVARDRKKLGLSMILGGCGATLEELTGLFSALANEGVYRPLNFGTGQIIEKTHRLLTPAASFMITEILSRVNRPDFPLNWTATERMPKIAWKTGTSYGRRDAWSIGYNRNFTVGVWVGNFSGAGAPDLSGANTATPLLFRIFNTIDYDSNSEWYDLPRDCDWRQVCHESGMVPGPYCTALRTDYFIPLASSTQLCTHMQEVMVSPDLKTSYCESCAPAQGFVRKLYNSLSPELEDFLSRNGTSNERIPPHSNSCEKIFRGNGPAITSPLNGSEYLVNREEPEPIQLKAITGPDVSRVYWYINDRFFRAAHPREKLMFIPGEGPVKISCADDRGRNRDIRIRVKYIRL